MKRQRPRKKYLLMKIVQWKRRKICPRAWLSRSSIGRLFSYGFFKSQSNLGKISAQHHTIVKQICFPNDNVLFLSLFSLSKNWMHNVVWGCAEILPQFDRCLHWMFGSVVESKQLWGFIPEYLTDGMLPSPGILKPPWPLFSISKRIN